MSDFTGTPTPVKFILSCVRSCNGVLALCAFQRELLCWGKDGMRRNESQGNKRLSVEHGGVANLVVSVVEYDLSSG